MSNVISGNNGSTTKTSTPATGYRTESLLTNIVKTQATKLAKDQATKFISNKATSLINDKLGKAGGGGGLMGSALNKATQSARSASDKISSLVGGKLGSSLGTGLLGQGLSQGLNGLSSKLTDAASKQLNNLATGATSKLSSLAQNKLGGALGGVLGGKAGDLLSQALSGLSDTGVKNLVSARIVPGFLTNGPKAETLTEDVYGVSDNNLLNNVGDKITGFAKDAFNDIRKSPSLVTDLTSLVMSGGKNWAVTKEGLADRVMGSLGGKRGLISNLGSQFKETIAGGLGLPDDIYDTIVVTIADKTTSFRGEPSNARQVFSLVNQVTRDSQLSGYFDVGSESALMSGVMREALALKVPDVIDVLVENAKDDQIAYNALYANMREAVEQSDLDTILLMIQKVGINAFKSQVPDAATLLLQNYVLPVGTTTEEYDSELESLKVVLLLLDDRWDQIERNGTWIQDLTPFANISDDAQKLMQRDDELMVPSLIAGKYTTSPKLVDELQQMYPLVPFA